MSEDFRSASLPEGFGLEEFQKRVLSSIPVLEAPGPDLLRGGSGTDENRAILKRLLTEKFGAKRARSELAVLAASGDMTSSAKAYLAAIGAEIASAKEQGKEIVSRSDFKHSVCAALNSVSNDVFSIAKVLTPVLAGLVAAGTIVLPLSPLVFGAVSLAVSRMGISALCAEYKEKEKDGDEIEPSDDS